MWEKNCHEGLAWCVAKLLALLSTARCVPFSFKSRSKTPKDTSLKQRCMGITFKKYIRPHKVEWYLSVSWYFDIEEDQFRVFLYLSVIRIPAQSYYVLCCTCTLYLSVIRRPVQNYSVVSFTWVWFKKISSELFCYFLYLSVVFSTWVYVVRIPVKRYATVFSTWVL
jgi:hypothetical protein